MSKFRYNAIWFVVNLACLFIFQYSLDITAWKVCLIFFVGNLSGMMCEYIGNDLKILNQDRK